MPLLRDSAAPSASFSATPPCWINLRRAVNEVVMAHEMAHLQRRRHPTKDDRVGRGNLPSSGSRLLVSGIALGGWRHLATAMCGISPHFRFAGLVLCLFSGAGSDLPLNNAFLVAREWKGRRHSVRIDRESPRHSSGPCASSPTRTCADLAPPFPFVEFLLRAATRRWRNLLPWARNSWQGD